MSAICDAWAAQGSLPINDLTVRLVLAVVLAVITPLLLPLTAWLGLKVAPDSNPAAWAWGAAIAILLTFGTLWLLGNGGITLNEAQISACINQGAK